MELLKNDKVQKSIFAALTLPADTSCVRHALKKGYQVLIQAVLGVGDRFWASQKSAQNMRQVLFC